MKKIEDYLHLYLGCECLFGVKVPNQEISFNKQRVDTRVIHNVLNGLAECKPLLRPLSDLTEEEAEHFAWLCMDSRHHLEKDCRVSRDEIQIELAKNDDGLLLDNDVEIYIGVSCRCFEGAVIIRKDRSICVEDEEGKKREPIDDIAYKVHYLLSKHFDLFGLVEAGLAIDKTITEAGEK